MSDLMTQPGTLGDFDVEPGAGAISELTVEVLTVDLVAEWKRCSVVSDFVARYFAPNFAAPETAASVLSTVLNELVENATKFSCDPSLPIRLWVGHFGERLRIDVHNVSSADTVRTFAARLEEMLTGDVESLFVRRLTEPLGGIGRGAGIGLIILSKDYGARVGARLLPRDGSSFDVHVQVTLTTADIEQER